MKIDNAPTPHNTPASVLSSSYLKNGIPSLSNNSTASSASSSTTTERGAFASLTKSGIPQTIHEEDLLHSIQDKLGDLIGTDSGYIDSLPKKVKQRVWALSALQQQLFQLEREFQIEMFELEQKYLGLYAPVFERRAKIVGGEVEPTEDEIKEGESLVKEEGESEEEEEAKEEEEEEEESSDAKGIPAFWLTALENLPIVNETITDRDAEVLEHLTDIKLQYLESGKPGFKLVFEFNTDTNTYFSNPTLTKTYYYQSELGYSGDFIYDHAEGEEIKWLSNAVNVTVLVETRKQRNKHTKQIRTIERLTPVESFFNFFDPPTVDGNDDDNDADKKNKADGAEAKEGKEEEENENDDDDDDLEARLALDYSIGEQIKDKLIPRAVDWFTGAALEFEFMDESEAEDDDDEEEEEEGESEDDDDEEEEHDDFKGVKEEPPECKQQ